MSTGSAPGMMIVLTRWRETGADTHAEYLSALKDITGLPIKTGRIPLPIPDFLVSGSSAEFYSELGFNVQSGVTVRSLI